MAKSCVFSISMKDGTKKDVSGIVIDGVWGIDKREDKSFYLTHIPTGALVTNASTQKALKELVSRPDMIDETSVDKIAKAVGDFWNSRRWKG